MDCADWIIKIPEESEWECWMFGSDADGSGICWRPARGSVPNFFWRWMQFVCFGNRWVRKGARNAATGQPGDKKGAI